MICSTLDTLRGYQNQYSKELCLCQIRRGGRPQLGPPQVLSRQVATLRTGKESSVNDQERIDRLERQLAELEARLPKHSVPPAMIIEMEELEEELERLKTRVRRDTE